MAIFWTIVAILLLIAAGLLFAYGPYIIETVVDKIDEWADIIDAFKEEK